MERKARGGLKGGNAMKMASALIAFVTAITSAFLLARPQTSAVAAQPLAFHGSNSGESSMEQQVVASEREGLDALKAGNLELFANLTADDAVFVDAHGPASKADVLKNVAGFKLAEYSMEDVKFVPISSKSGLITYKISEKGVSHGKEFGVQSWISSIWTKRGGKWMCQFSQETGAR
jgi:hypothetical protein